jgi:hypothetical protein
MVAGNVRGGKNHSNDPIVVGKSVLNIGWFHIVGTFTELEMIWEHAIFDIFGYDRLMVLFSVLNYYLTTKRGLISIT